MKSAKNELLQFLAGLVMLIAGLFIFSQKVVVHSSFLSGFSMGGIRMTSGLIIVPLIIGIVWMFATGASFASKVMTGVGVFLILVAIIASTSMHLTTMTLYDWILILVLIFGGAGLLAKVLLVGDYKEDEHDRGGYRARKTNRRQSGSSYTGSTTGAGSSVDVEAELNKMKKGK
ncbi:MAG: hypothetical protein J1E61_03175 [Lachnospiraceae bacterium]|nr:hypothetical protein [Lachnospiraceae bacterium]